MSYNIKLYVHGVPNGQKSWGVDNDAIKYIESLYGRKFEMPVQMLVEVMQTDKSINCFYTYLRTNNIQDDKRRDGSYFALTIRIAHYYADLQNIYNLLDAAFNKYIINYSNILTKQDEIYKYSCSDFTSYNKELEELKTEINHYLGNFSSDSDFIPLNGFQHNKSAYGTINLLECNAKNIEAYIRQNGGISVSPLYPSNATKIAIKQIQQRKAEYESDMKKQIEAIKLKAEQEKQSLKEQSDNTINDIRNKYDNKHKQYEDKEKQYDKLKKDYELLKSENNNIETKFNNLVKSIHSCIEPHHNSYERQTNIYGPTSHNNKGSDTPHTDNTDERKSWPKFLKFIPYIIILLIFVEVSVLLCFFLKPNNNKKLSITNETTIQSSYSPDYTDTASMQQSETFTDNKYNNAKIDIDVVKNNKMSIKKKGIATLKNVTDSPSDVEWVSEDFMIENKEQAQCNITPKHTGDCTIEYHGDGKTIVSRTITVTE